ncbi:dephospho-CoA kinase family protein [Cryptosporidium muris RN66]|uniref:Dephospho-CoA kinase family protein n=1 Tax=Cryptosporidium muris (strain RN66) TaxID=441375 RepID=B6AGL3_CRYMR|nr:dephospho-CoA kinase family protein [Cryptosporidium muris RN66]EEA07354.1 dephospho-CoA kinase family protein [Cryptosporidium muris RN66]|eukprot:XP_002141703.1 dephospho-CoA kinase family protein [Cryptosporidium muris RN66]
MIILIFIYQLYKYFIITPFLFLIQRISVIGLTGGVACGKTIATNFLEQYGFTIIDMDIISRKILMKDYPAYKSVVKKFGNEILLENGEINRQKLRYIVFKDDSKRKILNKMTHYYIFIETLKTLIWNRIILFKSNVIIVSPLLFESKIFTWICSPIYTIATTEERQYNFLINRDNCDSDIANSMIYSQLSIKTKCKLSDKIIWNNSNIKDFKYSIIEAFNLCFF